MRMRLAALMCTTLVAIGVAACGGGSKTVTVEIPPRLDLSDFARVGLATFTVENAKGGLHELATRRFAEQVLEATRGVEVLELNDTDAVLQQSSESSFGPASARLVGSAHQVPAVFAGPLKVSNVKPSGGLTSFGLPHVEATVSVELTVALYSTQTGGTLWRAGAGACEKVGHLSIVRGEPSFSAKDPEAAYGRLVDRLIAVVSRDLYPTYERRTVQS
jgi:hypothetical protein